MKVSPIKPEAKMEEIPQKPAGAGGRKGRKRKMSDDGQPGPSKRMRNTGVTQVKPELDHVEPNGVDDGGVHWTSDEEDGPRRLGKVGSPKGQVSI